MSRVVPVKDIEDYLIANPLLAAGERELRAKVMAGDWKELDYSQLKPIVDKVRTLSTLEENN